MANLLAKSSTVLTIFVLSPVVRLAVDYVSIWRHACERLAIEGSRSSACIRCCVKISNRGPSTKVATLFWNNCDPLRLSHFVTHLETP